MHKDLLQLALHFDWDSGNVQKVLNTHDVTTDEAEQVFANEPLIILDDEKHSQAEKHYNALGKTLKGRRLFLTFTIRNHAVRVISARDMDKYERKSYGEKEI